MIDPLDSLAFSMHASKGVYAVLIGSGVSRAAAIPTGWEVILDLVRRLAAAMKVDPEPDPEKWFKETFEQDPSYSALLEELGITPSERQGVLKGYIEPNEEDREAGRKMPTKAHRAIAELVSKRFVRVILTTNFDRLTEQALEGMGVNPHVVSTPDAVEGMTPLAHTTCTVVKLHGDYLDARIKNTITELESYDPKMDRLLDQILDEYGLIVCGWSGEWDTALRAAIERCPNRRYSTYWLSFREPAGRGAELVRHRRAIVVPNMDADSFFTRLTEKVVSLEEFARPHPLTTAGAVASLKRYIPDPIHRVRLGDLVYEVVDRLVERVSGLLSATPTPGSYPEVAKQAARIEALSETALAVFAAGGYWGVDSQNTLWVRAIERLASLTLGERQYTNSPLGKLRLYPALLCTYAGGLGALTSGRYSLLKGLLYDVFLLNGRSERRPSADVLDTNSALDHGVARAFPGRERAKTPASDRLQEVLRPQLRAYIPSDTEYVAFFDLFEYLRGLVAHDLGLPGTAGGYWWRNRTPDDGVVRRLDELVAETGNQWEGFRGGLFKGDMGRYNKARADLVYRVQESAMYYR